MNFKERWYIISYQEQEEKEEPIWDKIPIEKVDSIRLKYENRPWINHTEVWYGTQIEHLASLRKINILSLNVT